MEALKLNENEQKRYEELFQMCDLGKTSKIPKLVVGELLASSGLPTDVSLQIADMCGASRLGYFGRSQFYIALKLISVAQQQLPLAFESFANKLPLPAFNHAALNAKLCGYDSSMYNTILPEPQTTQAAAAASQPNSAAAAGVVSVPLMMPGGVLLPPPTKKHVRNMSGTGQQVASAGPTHIHTVSAPPPGGHLLPLTSSNIHQQNTSAVTNNHTTTSLSQAQVKSNIQTTHNNNHQQSSSGSAAAGNDTGWASFPSPTKPTSHTIETQPQSPTSPVVQRAVTPTSKAEPSTASDSGGSTSATAAAPLEWNHLGGSKRSFNFDSCSLSSADYATSEASESQDDVWSINDEQREYYVNQFLSMQPDLTSTIKGVIAKEFFEKSKLPTKELSKIWKLSDVNRDGALTLQEFCTAMHLVVLRRNDVELPSTLPTSLMPYIPASSEPFAADLGDEQTDRSPSPLLHQSSWSVGAAGGANSSTDAATNSSSVNNHHWQHDIQTSSASNTTHDHNQWQQQQMTGGSEVSSVSQLHWRASVDSGTSPPNQIQAQWTGSSHSPTSKPVNFDSAPATICDPEIAHPVAVKVSPSSQNKLIDTTNSRRPRTDSEPVAYDPTSGSVTSHGGQLRHRSNTEIINIDTIAGSNRIQPLPVRPRPTPKKAQSMGPATMDTLLTYPHHQSVQGYQSLPGGPPTAPPTVPPRNQWTSSDIGNDPFSATAGDINTTSIDNDDPFITKGDVGNENFADFSMRFGEVSNEPFGAADHHSGDAAAVIMMSGGGGGSGVESNANAAAMHHQVMLPTVPPSEHPTVVSHQFSIRDKREIQTSIRAQRERNLILTRINSELNSELQEVMEQRISLEIQLEHLKPC